MRAALTLTILGLLGAALLAEPIPYLFTVDSGTVELQLQIDDDPNVLTTSSTVNGSFTVTVDQANGEIAEADTFSLGAGDITNDEELSVMLAGVATATIQAGEARFLDFDFGNNDTAALDANLAGTITTESYVDAVIVVTGILDTTFSTAVWSDPFPWQLGVSGPAYHEVTAAPDDPNAGSVEIETVSTPSVSATLSGTHHLEVDIDDEITATLIGDIAVDIAGTAAAPPNGAAYPEGSRVRLTASAEPGHVFAEWTGDVSPAQSGDNPLTITVTRDAVLTATFTEQFSVVARAEPNRIVAGQPVTLTAEAGGGDAPYTYAWDTGQIGAAVVVEPTQSTDYVVTATDASGSRTTADVSVEVVPPVSVEVVAEPNTVAAGANARLTAKVTGGVAPYLYAWSTGDASDEIVVAPQETRAYTVTVVDDLGQSAQAEVTVAVAPALSVALFAEPGAVFVGDEVTVSAVTAGGVPPFEYAWSKVAEGDSLRLRVDRPQPIRVTVTDATGQSAKDQIALTPLCALEVSVVGPGTVVQTPVDQQVFEYGELVVLSARASDECSRFLGWEGSHDAVMPDLQILMDQDKELTAVFDGGTMTPSSCAGPGVCAIGLLGLMLGALTRRGRGPVTPADRRR